MIEPIARLRVELQDMAPKIWRRVDVPLSSNLMALHDIFQLLFGWRDEHLFEFAVDGKTYGDPDPNHSMFDRKVYKAKAIRLQTLVDRGIDRFLNIYDLGDYWRVDVMVEEIREGQADIDYPVFVDGARRGPPEDVGGTSGFEDFLAAVADPDHEDHESLLEWYGGSFDPTDIGERHIRMVLEMFAIRRRGPLMSHRSSGRTSTT